MRLKLLKSIFGATILLLMTSCNLFTDLNDEENLSSKAELNFRLKSISEDAPGKGWIKTQVFEYDEQGLIKSLGHPYKLFIQYFHNDAGELDSVVNLKGVGYYTVIEWSDNKPHIRRQYQDGELWAKTEFIYSGEKRIQAIREVMSEGIASRYVWDYEYSENNLKRVFINKELYCEFTSFDSNKNVFNTIEPWLYPLSDAGDDLLLLSKNNVLRYVIGGKFTHQYEYTFSDDKSIELDQTLTGYQDSFKSRFELE